MSEVSLGVLCRQCRHLRDDYTCAAFPRGIPDIITGLYVDHSAPVEGDSGIQFEPRQPGDPEPQFRAVALEEATAEERGF